MNKCVLTGHITKKPELKKINENSCVCDFTIATNRPTNRDGEKVADFINCRVWNKQAENLCKYQDKGNLIGVSGEIRTDNYEVNGTKKYKTYVLTNNIEFLESKKDNIDKISSKTITQETIEYTNEDLPWSD